VADFHRLPEHPGDCRDELSCSFKEQPECHGTIFHDINIYSRRRAAKSKHPKVTRGAVIFVTEILNVRAGNW